jgi:hypothetical protein
MSCLSETKFIVWTTLANDFKRGRFVHAVSITTPELDQDEVDNIKAYIAKLW